MSDAQNWSTLADAVNRRREELGWSRGGFTLISDDTAVYMIEWNRRNGPVARVLPIEHELGWRPGLALEVLAGTATEEEIMPKAHNEAAASSDGGSPPDPPWSEILTELRAIREAVTAKNEPIDPALLDALKAIDP